MEAAPGHGPFGIYGAPEEPVPRLPVSPEGAVCRGREGSAPPAGVEGPFPAASLRVRSEIASSRWRNQKLSRCS